MAREIVCESCGKSFCEHDGNPAVHYSTPEKICYYCKIVAAKKPGEWYQNANGEYVQKGVLE